MRRGFILIVVLGLLGALVFTSLLVTSVASRNKNLTDQFLLLNKTKILAQSGFEYVLTQVTNDILYFDRKGVTKSLGDGTFVSQGDSYHVSSTDSSARININDGVNGGLLEDKNNRSKDFAYRANALDPHPNDEEKDYSAAEAGYSGFNNLRLRRILNAYGEVHRFTDKVCRGNHKDLSSYYGDDLPEPVFSTPNTQSADGRVGRQMAYYIAGTDPMEYQYDMSLNTGLGDRIVGYRPEEGYREVEDVRSIVNEWAQLSINNFSSSYLDGQSFFDLIKNDLSVVTFEDQFARLRKPTLFGFLTHPSMPQKGDYLPVIQALNNPFQDSFSVQPFFGNMVNLININQASFFVKAALFYAPTNVTLTVDGTTTIAPYFIGKSPSYITEYTGLESMVPYPTMGAIHPVFEDGKEGMLNGIRNQGHRNHLMSLRDAMHLANAYEDYIDPEGQYKKQIISFDDFREFLIHHETNGFLEDGTPPYEKVFTEIPDSYQDDEEFNAGGLFYVAPFDKKGVFTQDYVSNILPHIFSSIRRTPSWYGAPAALQSPYMVHKPDYFDSRDYGYQKGEFCVQGFRKVEDFVHRLEHPKVCFMPTGLLAIDSKGRVEDAAGEVIAENRLKVVLDFFKTIYIRSQLDFFNNTFYSDEDVLSTSEDIIDGPEPHEFTQPLKENNNSISKHFGFIGLRDFDQDMTLDPFMTQSSEYQPQIVLNFSYNPHADPIIYGKENTSEHPDITPELVKNPGDDKWVDALKETPPEGSIYKGVNNNSSLEWVSEQFRHRHFSFSGMTGTGNCDMSPFNGIRLSAVNHGLFQEGVNSFQDTAYYRLDPWLDESKPIGESVASGLMSFWFRMPSDYDYPTVLKGDGGTKIYSQSFSRALVHLNFWEKYVYRSGTQEEIERPVAITVGLKRTKQNGQTIFARYDSGSEHYYQAAIPHRYRGPDDVNNKDFSVLQPSPMPLSAPVEQYDMLGFWCNADNLPFVEPAAFNYQSYRWAAHRSAEVSVTFKNHQENGPGTWHRISVYWNLGWDETSGVMDSANQLYLDLHDHSNKEGEHEFRHGVSYAPPLNYSPEDYFDYPSDAAIVEQGANIGFMLPFNESMILSLGEAHGRYLDEYEYLPGDGGFTSSIFSKKLYRPFWRLNSCLDNFRFWMGPHEEAQKFSQYFTPHFVSSQQASNQYSALRYKVIHEDHDYFDETHEPTWVFKPAIKEGGKVFAVGARVYYPPDSNNNTPYVYLKCTYDDEQAVTSTLIEPRAVSKNEQIMFYKLAELNDQFRIRCQYKAFKPILDGDLSNIEQEHLVYHDEGGGDEADNVTNIAWIKELSLRYVPPQGHSIISWNEFKTGDPAPVGLEYDFGTGSGDDDDDDDDDDDGPGGGTGIIR